MARVILAGFLCAVFVAYGNSAVTLDVTPPVIQIGQTESLDVVCKVDKGDSPSTLFFIALSHSPSADGSNFSYLAYLNSADVKLTTPDTAAVAASGLMNGSGDSHVTLTWRRPAQGRAGVYKCDVTGIDASGGPVAVSKLAAVTASGDDGSGFWRLSDKVADLHGRLDSLQESQTREVTEVRNETSDLQHQIFNIRSSTSDLQPALRSGGDV